jgi:hypothetical protein
VPPQALIELSALPSTTKRKLQGILNQPPPPPPIPPPPPPDPVAMKKLDLEAMHKGDEIKLKNRQLDLEQWKAGRENAADVANHQLEQIRLSIEAQAQRLEETRQMHDARLGEADRVLEAVKLRQEAATAAAQITSKATDAAPQLAAAIEKFSKVLAAPTRVVRDAEGKIVKGIKEV